MDYKISTEDISTMGVKKLAITIVSDKGLENDTFLTSILDKHIEPLRYEYDLIFTYFAQDQHDIDTGNYYAHIFKTKQGLSLAKNPSYALLRNIKTEEKTS